MDNEVLVLAKPRRKGLLGLLFSRFFVIVILLALQIALIVLVYMRLYQFLPHFWGLMFLFLVGGIVYLFNCGMDNSARLTWLLIIAVMPVAGVAILAFTQTNLGNRAVKEQVEKLIAGTMKAIPQPEGVLEQLARDGSATDDLNRYVCRSGCFPVYDKTQSTFFPIGEEMFASMLAELKKAEKFIFLEFFIIREGYMWGSILKILADKAAAGVEVRVLYDGMLEVSTLPGNYCRLLKEHGIKAKEFSPIRPLISSHYNYRDHRKILVIDGKVGYTGGVNLADEYINREERFGHWKDTGLMLKGDAVKSLTLMFLQMWNIDEQEPQFEPWISEGPKEPERSDGFVMPYCDCPLDDDKVGEMVYMDLFNRASDYVHVMTPYLILDGELETAIKYAAQRGVEVKLILPGIPDKTFAYSLAKSHYKRLVEAGVQIYEYTPGFVHAKVFTSDGCKAVIGTINLDYRSLYHHYECAAYLYKASCIAEIEKDFQKTLEKCRRVSLETIRQEKIKYKVLGQLGQFIAPLM